jgi:hypothetical protein
VDKTVKHATNMLVWLDKKSGIEKSSEDYSKLRAVLERSVKPPKRTEANNDYEGMASLIDLFVNKKQNIKFNPKFTTYNSALLQIQKSSGKSNNKWYRHHVAEMESEGLY